MKPTSETPMMRQYREAKRAAGDALLLFRMGDFYELFYDDACKAANLLGLTLTTRDRNKGPDAMPMAGFPHHQLDLYLAKLIAAGCKAAVCEQMEDPKKAKTIVKREVIRVVTPGTVTDESILDPKTSNYLAAVTLPAKPRMASADRFSFDEGEGEKPRRALSVDPLEKAGVAWIELSTGEFTAATVTFQEMTDLLARIHPAELLVPESYASLFSAHGAPCMLTVRPDWGFALRSSVEKLHALFKVSTLEGYGFSPESDPLAVGAAGGVLDYLSETQKQSLDHIERIQKYQPGGQLEIDEATQRSLEILRSSRDGRREGSLLDAVDSCITAMGSRLLASWLAYPLTDIQKIGARQDAVEELLANPLLRDLIRQVSDRFGQRVAVVDERGELAACLDGSPQLRVGRLTDVLSFCGKAEGIELLLRSMRPDWIALDEISAEEDLRTILRASYCGARFLATVHVLGPEDLRRRPLYRRLMEAGVFENLIYLEKDRSLRCERVDDAVS